MSNNLASLTRLSLLSRVLFVTNRNATAIFNATRIEHQDYKHDEHRKGDNAKKSETEILHVPPSSFACCERQVVRDESIVLNAHRHGVINIQTASCIATYASANEKIKACAELAQEGSSNGSSHWRKNLTRATPNV